MAGSVDGSAFGELLRRFRLRAALSQDELAARAGLSARGISDLERGARRSPYLTTVRRLTDALGLDEADRTALLAARGETSSESPNHAAARVLGVPPLPVPLTPLIGREKDVEHLCALLRMPDVRLVTLTGPGGVGKTRLALAVAAALTQEFDAVHVIDLAPVHLPERVLSVTAQTLDVRAIGEEALGRALAHAMRGQRILLVFDNFEHLLPAAPQVANLLAACPQMRALVTSRARLHVRGERDYVVPPLGLPADGYPALLDELATTGAVLLFLARAREVQPEFTLTDANAEAVAAICQRLDGLPLAIELAAARVTVLPPKTLLARLDRRLPLLTGGPRDLPARLRTMHDAIAWSHALLTAEEQMLFRRLAVFNGGFSLEGAEAVSGDDDGNDTTLLDTLASLVDHSLVRKFEDVAGQPRFVMLETIREHAQEQLRAAGEEEIMQARHAVYFRALADDADRAYIGPDRAAWADRVQTEHDNFLAALRWYLDRRDGDSSLRIISGLYALWHWRGQLVEYREWAQKALAVSAGQPSARRSEAIDQVAELAVQQGDDAGAARLYAEALADALAVGDVEGIARAKLRVGQAAFAMGDLARARMELEAARQAFQEHEFPLWEAAALGELGRVARAAGTPALAVPYLERALALYQEGNYVAAFSWIIRLQGQVALDLGDRSRACALLAEALGMDYQKRAPRPIADCLTVLADIAQRDRRPEIAARLLGAAEALREHVGAIMSPSDRADNQRLLAAVRASLDTATLEALWASGRSLTMDEAVAEALASTTDEETSRAPRAWAYQNGVQEELSPREQAVLRLIVEGRTDQEIADTLSISRRTVSTHVTSILAKLRLTNRVQAATYAVRHELI